MAGLTFKEPIIIPARSGAAFVVRKGENIKVINVEGGQIGDFICFNLHNFRERLRRVKLLTLTRSPEETDRFI